MKCDTTSAVQPLSIACGANSCASTFEPLIQKNKPVRGYIAAVHGKAVDIELNIPSAFNGVGNTRYEFLE